MSVKAPITFTDSKNETYAADRTFSHTTLPDIMEMGGKFYYYGSRDIVTSSAHLIWLPEPHRSRALEQVVQDAPEPETDPEIEVTEVAKDTPKKRGPKPKHAA